MTISNVLAHLIGLTSNVTGAYTTVLFVIDPPRKSLVVREHFSLSSNFDRDVRIPWDEFPLRQVVRTLKPLLMDHFDLDPSQLSYYRKAEDIKSFLAIPVFYKTLDGVLVLDTREPYRFPTKIQKIVGGFAAQMAWHLHHQNFQPQPANLVQTAIREVNFFNRYILESPNREAVAQRLIQLPPSIVKADAVGAIWFDDSDGEGKIQKHRGFNQDLSKLDVISGRGIVGSCAKNQTAKLVRNLDSSETFLFSDQEKTEGFRSVAAIPITFHEHLLGVLLCARRYSKILSRTDLDILALITSSAGSALFFADTKSRWDYSKKKDLITGVPNHHFLNDNHAAIAEKIFKEKGQAFFMTVQISNLPEIYESFGTKTGNMLVRQIASMFSRVVPSPKFVFKYSDTTFLIIMMKMDREQAARIETKLKKLFDKNSLYVDRKSMTVKTEWGLSIYPEDGDDLLRLIDLSRARTFQPANAAS